MAGGYMPGIDAWLFTRFARSGTFWGQDLIQILMKVAPSDHANDS